MVDFLEDQAYPILMRCRLAYLCLCGAMMAFLWSPSAAHAAKKMSKALGFSANFYTGKASSSITAGYGGGVSFTAHQPLNRYLYVKHRFGIEGFMGANFAAEHGSYFGAAGTYDLNMRVNLSKTNLQPYLEAGPILGMYVIRLGVESDTVSPNQASLKYGYIIGSGFDWMFEDGGFGIGVSYFKFLKSPALFEFPAAPMEASGIRLEFRYLFSNR